jgi:class 3 adenylate cyclase
VQVGLRSAFAFPIVADHQVLGVMTFFTQTPQIPDRELLQVMAATGRQLGQYIKRKEAERSLAIQQQQTERLLLNVLPQSIVTQLQTADTTTIADQFDQVSILFADLVGFTSFAATLSPVALLEVLNLIFSEFDALTERHGLEKIKTLGDAYMVVGGVPSPCPEHARKIARMALDMQRAIARLNQTQGYNFQLRIGINSGPVIAGVIGTKKFIYDLWGDAVNVASRMESQGVPGKIQLTAATRDLLGDRFCCEERGPIDVKGRGWMTTYFLLDGPGADRP